MYPDEEEDVLDVAVPKLDEDLPIEDDDAPIPGLVDEEDDDLS